MLSYLKHLKEYSMKTIICLFLILLIGANVSADGHNKNGPHAEKKAEIKQKIEAQRNAVETACSEDATKTGCAGKEVGEGLLKCMKAFKEANKDFTFSESCKNARKELHKDRKELKADKKAFKDERKAERDAKHEAKQETKKAEGEKK